MIDISHQAFMVWTVLAWTFGIANTLIVIYYLIRYTRDNKDERDNE